MRTPFSRARSIAVAVAFNLVLLTAAPPSAIAQPVQSEPAAVGSRLGVQGIATVGIEWPSASSSYDAVGLDARPMEIGGGIQVSNVWRDVFAQAFASRTSTTGERAFIDDDGNTFPLGIPLEVRTTYVDVSGGWTFAPQADSFQRLFSYAGGGVGVVKLTEQSPFAQPGDDVDSSAVSYHVMGGVEIRLLRWLSVSGDLRYRWVPGLLGDGGVSGVLDDDDFGGFHAGVGLRIGVGGRRGQVAPRPEPLDVPRVPPSDATRVPGSVRAGNSATVIADAPVYLKPDETREPLRTLEVGTRVTVLQEDREWVRIEFTDRLLGPRVGFVLRQHLRIAK